MTSSGLVGRFGRFWQFGLREYGQHTSTKFLRMVNRYLLNVMATALQNEAFSKWITHKNRSIVKVFVFSRVYALVTFFLIAVGLVHSFPFNLPE